MVIIGHHNDINNLGTESPGETCCSDENTEDFEEEGFAQLVLPRNEC